MAIGLIDFNVFKNTLKRFSDAQHFLIYGAIRMRSWCIMLKKHTVNGPYTNDFIDIFFRLVDSDWRFVYDYGHVHYAPRALGSIPRSLCMSNRSSLSIRTHRAPHRQFSTPSPSSYSTSCGSTRSQSLWQFRSRPKMLWNHSASGNST